MHRDDRPRWPLFLAALGLALCSSAAGVMLGLAAWNLIAGRPW